MDKILVALSVIGILAFVVSCFVEVLKRVFANIPTDIVVFATSIVLTTVAMVVCCGVYQIPILWFYWVGSPIAGIIVAYITMFGWEKFHALWIRFQFNKNNK